MADLTDELAQIIAVTDSIADPMERVRERQRLTRELYGRQRTEIDEEADEAEAYAVLAECAVEIAPDRPDVRRLAARIRRNAARIILRRAVVPQRLVPLPVVALPRPREHRERRHVARSTSSADSGDDDLPQIRWCDRCGIVAFAIDGFQRAQLDALGFTDLCPDCRREVEP
jgi:hypothetical protein